MTQAVDLDVIIVGGGLSGCLAAWLIKHRVPELRLRLIESDAWLGGNHTWSFFSTDLAAHERASIERLIVYRWSGYRVQFPRLARKLSAGYFSITSRHLHQIVSGDLGEAVVCGERVDEVGPGHVRLASGGALRAHCVIDARGPTDTPNLAIGYQKFLGLELQLDSPHGEVNPLIMDATVAQTDGYRFVYTLPLAVDRVLIEDTYYSDGIELELDALRKRTLSYATARGWKVRAVVREEQGVLPIVLAGDIEGHLSSYAAGAPRIGLAAALFHPTTGYSLPDAVRTAHRLAELAAIGPLDTARARTGIDALVRDVWRERAYFRLLNRMMFKAGLPHERYRILERFYGLDEGLIQRFYAGALTTADRCRILVGKPPVPILSAISCVSESAMLNRMKVR